MDIAPGTRCPWCCTQIVATPSKFDGQNLDSPPACPSLPQIVAAAPMRQATSGEVGGDARHATEPAPRTFAASAPPPATSPQPPLPGRGTPCAEQRHGADAALNASMGAALADAGTATPIGALTPASGFPAMASRPSDAARDDASQGEPAQSVRGGYAADMAPQHGAAAPAGSPAPSLLDLIDATPRARVTDPDTAHQAAGFQAGKLRESHRLVLTTLSLAPLTDFELGARTGKAQTSIGCRRGELTRAGMVADTGNTRPAPSGAPAAVWAITDLGRQALAREQARSNAA